MRNLGPAIASRRRVLHAATPEPSQPSRSSLLPLANAGSSLLHTLKLSLTSQYSETGSGLRANTKRRKSPGLEICTSVMLLVEFINILIFFFYIGLRNILLKKDETLQRSCLIDGSIGCFSISCELVAILLRGPYDL